MAEAAGLVASIIAIIQIADRIVGVTKHYIETVQDAPRDLHRIRTELSTLKAVFESLQFVHSLDPATSFTLRALDGPAGAVEICKNIVIELEKLLHPSSSTIPHNKRQKIKGTWEALAWPFKESKVGKLLEDLSRIKTTISLALSSETT